MSNYIVSYDLNGKIPSHSEMDQHMNSAGWSRGRILETVWYVGTSNTLQEVYSHLKKKISDNDMLVVIKADSATWNKILIEDKSIIDAWKDNG
jgi:hypothetical protein